MAKKKKVMKKAAKKKAARKTISVGTKVVGTKGLNRGVTAEVISKSDIPMDIEGVPSLHRGHFEPFNASKHIAVRIDEERAPNNKDVWLKKDTSIL